MEYAEIEALTNDYYQALKAEYDNKLIAHALEAQWYTDGLIDGKNAEVRTAQFAALEIKSETHWNAAIAGINATVLREKLALIKAWLYSQGGKL